MTLYTLSGERGELLRLISEAEDPQDLQALLDTLEGLDGQLNAKVIDCAFAVQNLLRTEEAVAAEIERLEGLSNRLTNARNRLKLYMHTSMEAAGVDKVKGDLFTVSLVANPPKTVVDDEDAVPVEFKKTVVTVRIADVAKAIKAGNAVPGVHQEQSRSLRIR